MNLVIGATGLLGGEICRQLRQAGKPVRALTRATADPVKVERLKRSGATLVQGDLKDRASLDAACRGVATVITTASTTFSRQAGDSIQTVDLDGQVRLVDAAKAAGVSRFVYVSYSHQINVDCPLTTAKRSVEAHLQQSGMTFTILAPSVFMEVWLSPALGFDPGNGSARVYGSGEAKISYISAFDVAGFAVVAATKEYSDKNTILEIGGPDALSQLQAVLIFEQALGISVQLDSLSEQALQQQHSSSDPLQKTFAALMLGCAKGDVISGARALAEQYGISLRSVMEYAAHLRAQQLRVA